MLSSSGEETWTICDRSRSTIRCFRASASLRLPVPPHFRIRVVTSSRQLRHHVPNRFHDVVPTKIWRSVPFGNSGSCLGTRQISSVELTKFYLERLRRYDPLLKCVVTFMDDLALKQAERADSGTVRANEDRGPLHGIPWGGKDIFSYPGYPTTWGVWQCRDRVIDVKAAVAERLEKCRSRARRETGHKHLGRRIGRVVSRHHPQLLGIRTGDAGARVVGAGCGRRRGTRRLCHRHGNFGKSHRPFHHLRYRGTEADLWTREPIRLQPQLCWSLDKTGPMCRNAEDCGLVLAAIHGAGSARDADSVDRPYVWPSSRALSTIRVGYVPKGGKEEQREDHRILRELRVKLVPVEPPDLKKGYGLPKNEIQAGLVASESAAAF